MTDCKRVQDPAESASRAASGTASESIPASAGVVDDEDVIDVYEVVLGLYEHVVYGFGCLVMKSKHSEPAVPVAVELHRSFATATHSAAVTAMAASGAIVVSGSSDELMKCVVESDPSLSHT